MNRREFLKTTGLVAFSFSFLNTVFASFARAAAECTTADPVANALGYVSLAKQIDVKKYPQFKKLKKEHACKGCSLYKETGGGLGQCTMLANCAVAAGGLCGSWQKKV